MKNVNTMQLSATETEGGNAERALVPADQIHTNRGLANLFVAKKASQLEGVQRTAILEGFEDKSLPPIIKAADLAPGNVIIGQIIGMSSYTQDNIDSALLTLEILDADEKGQLVPVGQKAAMPVGAVLARSLGTKAEKKYSSEQQIADIKKAGYENAIIAMRYNGTGKERGNGKNAPHLWDIKVKKASGAVHTHSERVAPAHAKPANKR